MEGYFDAAGDGQPPHHADRPITTREALKAYDPDLFALVEETMAYRETRGYVRQVVADLVSYHALYEPKAPAGAVDLALALPKPLEAGVSF